jgi:serine beta-lactamase-like protein LACTB
VDLATVEGVKFDIRYATDNNFLGVPFYTSAKAYLQKPAATRWPASTPG